MMKTIFILIILFNGLLYSQSKQDSIYLEKLNTVRTEPESIIPYINEYINHLESIKFIFSGNPKNKKALESINDRIIESKKTIDFIKNQKPLNPLKFDTTAYDITKKHCQEMVDKGEVFHKYLKEIPNLASQNCAGTPKGFKTDDVNIDILVMYIIDYPYRNSGYGHRKNIFNENVNNVTLTYYYKDDIYYDVINFID
jgi:uncharacterized protein YkwD